MKIACLSALALLLSLLLGLTSCAPKVRLFAYMDEGLETVLSGELCGVPYTAMLRGEARASATARACDFTLTYLSPESLAGVTVTYRAATDEVTLSLGTLSGMGTADTLLAAPGLLLLSERAAHTVTKNADGTLTVTTDDGASRLLAADGRPLALVRVSDGRQVQVKVGR